MFKEIKRLSQQSIIYGIGHYLVRGAQFLVIPIYTNFMLPAEFGDAGVILAWIGCANVLYQFGMDVAFLRFYIMEKEQDVKHSIFTTCWLLILGFGSLLSVLIYSYAPYLSTLMFQSPRNAELIRYAAVILWLDALAVIPFLILRAREQAKRFVGLKFLGVFVNIILNIIYVGFLRKGAEGIFISYIWSSAFTLVLILPYIIQAFKLSFNAAVLKEILRFGLPYIIPGLSIWALDLIDRQLIFLYLGEDATGLYHANYKFATAMALFVAAFRFAWHPFFLSIIENPDAKKIFARILTYFIGICGWFYLAMCFFIRDLVTFQVNGASLLGSEYWDGLSIIPLAMLGYIFYGAHVNFVVSIYITKKSYYLSFITVFAAFINILLNIYLLPRYGIMAAAFNTAVAYFCMAFAQYRLTQWLYPVPYEIGRIVKLTCVIAAVFVIGYWNWTGLQFLVKLLLIGLYPFILRLLGFFEPEELNQLKKAWQKRKGNKEAPDAMVQD